MKLSFLQMLQDFLLGETQKHTEGFCRLSSTLKLMMEQKSFPIHSPAKDGVLHISSPDHISLQEDYYVNGDYRQGNFFIIPKGLDPNTFSHGKC